MKNIEKIVDFLEQLYKQQNTKIHLATLNYRQPFKTKCHLELPDWLDEKTLLEFIEQKRYCMDAVQEESFRTSGLEITVERGPFVGFDENAPYDFEAGITLSKSYYEDRIFLQLKEKRQPAVIKARLRELDNEKKELLLLL